MIGLSNSKALHWKDVFSSTTTQLNKKVCPFEYVFHVLTASILQSKNQICRKTPRKLEEWVWLRELLGVVVRTVIRHSKLFTFGLTAAQRQEYFPRETQVI